MATVRATCPQCGDIQQTSKKFHIFNDGTSWTYRFECPDCQRLIYKSAIAAQVAGVPVTCYMVDKTTETQAPITPDDLLTFREQLKTIDLSEIIKTF